MEEAKILSPSVGVNSKKVKTSTWRSIVMQKVTFGNFFLSSQKTLYLRFMTRVLPFKSAKKPNQFRQIATGCDFGELVSIEALPELLLREIVPQEFLGTEVIP